MGGKFSKGECYSIFFRCLFFSSIIFEGKNTVQLYLLSTTNDSAERTSVGNKSKTG